MTGGGGVIVHLQAGENDGFLFLLHSLYCGAVLNNRTVGIALAQNGRFPKNFALPKK